MLRFILLALLYGLAKSASVSISNVLPRLDTGGEIVNAHDGCIVKFENTYFMYGTVYENCHQATPICDGKCGYLNNTFALYTSPDMVTWKLETNNILPQLDLDNHMVSYWMPNVGYNLLTKQYYMVFWSGHYGFVNSSIAMATSLSPYGPFVLVKSIPMQGAKVISSTLNLYVDPDDNTAYIRYNTRDSPLRHVVESLNAYWNESTGQFAPVFVKDDYPWYEGGGLFKRNGIFYTMIGTDCCFCQWGGDALVFVSKEPTTSWDASTEVNYCADGEMPAQSNITMSQNPCDLTDVQGTNYTIPAQQFNVVTVSSSSSSPNVTTYLFYGERFRSSPDGIKAHDFQAWIPLAFDDNGALQTMTWVDEFELNV